MKSLSQDDHEALLEQVKRVCQQVIGRDTAAAVVQTKNVGTAGQHAPVVITLKTGDGVHLRLFIKDSSQYLGWKPMTERFQRELVLYRDFLSKADLGTATYYDAVCDPIIDRYWLFLEYLPAQPLLGTEGHNWVAVSRWLARLQGYFASCSERLQVQKILLEHQPADYQSLAEDTLRFVSWMSGSLAAKIERIVWKSDGIAQLIASGPKTLVHGAFSANAHVMLSCDEKHSRVRICPVDWELAAFGSSAYDLAELLFDSDPQIFEMSLAAYRNEATQMGLAVLSDDELKLMVNCCRLQHALRKLRKTCKKGSSRSEIEMKVDTVVRLADCVL